MRSSPALAAEAPPPPHNLDAERAVLGAVLVRNEGWPEIADLRGCDFYRFGHRHIFEAMRRLVSTDTAVDTLTLAAELSKVGALEDAGGPAYIAGLVDGVPRSTNLPHYARIVTTLALEREGDNLYRAAQADILGGDDAGTRLARLADDLRALTIRALPPTGGVRAFTLPDLEGHVFDHRAPILMRGDAVILREGHLAQIHAMRGLGKTWLVQTFALIAAARGRALGFHAPDALNVLHIDGEMASEEITERYRVLRDRLGLPAPPNLVIIGADWQDDFLARLDTKAGQAAVEPFVDAANLIILDNRSTLFDPESESDPSAWQAAQQWLLSLRRRRKAVLLVHHANRNGGARGHSRPEDVMNLLIKLSRPEGYTADEGARFLLEFEKTRGIHGAAVAPFTARLTPDGWAVEASDTDEDRATAKLREFLTLAHDADERPASATAAIVAAKVRRQDGLKAWAVLKAAGQIKEHPDGGFYLA